MEMGPWELLLKKMIWQQLSFIHNKKVLDFGSGFGITASHFAADNEVIAIEPSDDSIQNRVKDNLYVQEKGSLDILKKMEDRSFDVILCHNVLEYVDNRSAVFNEFARLLKDDGNLSIVKHNRNGRVMQMVVLLNNFEHANELLDGLPGHSTEFGAINYYDDTDIMKWSDAFSIQETHGIRTFWDLQQNQDIQQDAEWQRKMLSIENKVSNREEFKSIAFFHHLLLRKRNIPKL